MNKLFTIPMVLMLMTVLFAADAMAQKGRSGSQQGNQRNKMQAGNQQGRQQGNQTGKQFSGRRQSDEAGNGTGNRAVGGNSLSALQSQGLSLMREEEKLARDVYLAMNAIWGERLFTNIARSESRHMQAMANLLSKYGISDPVTDNSPGSFTAVRFQQLYKNLVETGSNSLVDALKVGLIIEEMDIADLRVAIKSTTHQDIQRVYEQLERGSRNHLRAFAKKLNQAGGSYVPTSLSQADFDQIAGSGQERGNGQARGRGNRQGPGTRQGNAQNNGRSISQAAGRGRQDR